MSLPISDVPLPVFFMPDGFRLPATAVRLLVRYANGATSQQTGEEFAAATFAPADFSGIPLTPTGYGGSIFTEAAVYEKKQFQGLPEAYSSQLTGYQAQATLLGEQIEALQEQREQADDSLEEAQAALDAALATLDAAQREEQGAANNLRWQGAHGSAADQQAAEVRYEAASDAVAAAELARDQAQTQVDTRQQQASDLRTTWVEKRHALDTLNTQDIPAAQLRHDAAVANLAAAYPDTPEGQTPDPDRPLKNFRTVVIDQADGINSVGRGQTGAGINYAEGEYAFAVRLSGAEYRAAVAAGIGRIRIDPFLVTTSQPGFGVPDQTSWQQLDVSVALEDFASLSDEEDDWFALSAIAPLSAPELGSNRAVYVELFGGYELPSAYFAGNAGFQQRAASMYRPGFHPFVVDDAPGVVAVRYGRATATLNESAPPGSDYAGSTSVELSPTSHLWQVKHAYAAGQYPGESYALPPADVLASALLGGTSWQDRQGALGNGVTEGGTDSDQDADLVTLTATEADVSNPPGLHWALSAPIGSGVLESTLAPYVTGTWPADLPGDTPPLPPSPNAGDPLAPPRGSLGAGAIKPTDGIFLARRAARYRLSFYVPQKVAPGTTLPFRVRRWTTNLATGLTQEEIVAVPRQAGSDGRVAADVEWEDLPAEVGQMVQVVGMENEGSQGPDTPGAGWTLPFVGVAQKEEDEEGGGGPP